MKLMSHVRLHLLFLAEKLQEQLVAPEDQIASADSISQTKSQVNSLDAILLWINMSTK